MKRLETPQFEEKLSRLATVADIMLKKRICPNLICRAFFTFTNFFSPPIIQIRLVSPPYVVLPFGHSFDIIGRQQNLEIVM